MTWAFPDRWGNLVLLQGFARGEPDATIERVDAAFGEARASIVDVHFFAGVRTVLTFAVTPEELRALQAGLGNAGVELDEDSRAAIEKALAKQHDGDIDGMLAITFAHGDPNRKHVVPAVPG